MDRRRFISTICGGSSILLAGCSGGTAGSGTETPALPTEYEDPDYADQFTPRGPWPIDGHDSRRTGYNAVSRLPTGDVGTAWLRWLGTASTAPVADEDSIYVGYALSSGEEKERRDRVIALDARTGAERWARTLTPPNDAAADSEGIWPQGLVRASENVYVIAAIDEAGRSLVLALDSTDGEVTWQKTVPGYFSDALGLGDGALFVCVSGGEGADQSGVAEHALYALELDGSERWQQPLDSDVIQPVSVADGVLYAGLMDGRMVAVGSADGELLWERLVVEVEGTAPMKWTPSVDDDRIYVAGADGSLHAISREDGSLAWTFELRYAGDFWWAGPAIFDGTVYAGARHGGLLAVNAHDGSVRWQIEDLLAYRGFAVTDQGLVSGWNGTMRAFDHDGEARWTFEVVVPEGGPGDGGVNLTPKIIAAHDRVYVLLSDGRLYAIGSQ